MSVVDWIDKLAALWEVDDGQGGTVKSFRVYEKSEFPEALPPSTICALTFTTGVSNEYSVGGPLIDHWTGITEFHFPWGVDKSHFPAIMLFFARLRNAAAGDIQLGGTVHNFVLRRTATGGPSIEGPVVLQWGSEEPHHALVVHWTVKEDVTGDYSPAL